MTYLSKSEEDTKAFARQLSASLSVGDVVYLHGDLGAGKSVFARSAIRSLLGDEGLDVPSPTFTLVQIYEAKQCPVYHFDLYRIEDSEEVFELGWEDALAGGITIVEWPERLGGYGVDPTMDITISNVDGHSNARHIEVKSRDKDA